MGGVVSSATVLPMSENGQAVLLYRSRGMFWFVVRLFYSSASF